MTITSRDAEHDGDPDGSLCNGPKRQGAGTCTQVAGWGTDHVGVGRCKLHGGATQSHRKAGARKLVEMQVAEAAAALGGSIDVHPLDVLMDAVREAAANVYAIRSMILGLRVAVDHEGAVALPEQVIEFEKGGTYVPARLHVLVEFYGEERDRLARFAKLCLDAGVDERLVRATEADGQRFAQAFARALDDIGELVPPETRAALAQALATRLRALTAA